MGVPGLFSWLARRKYPEIVEALPDAGPDAPDRNEQSHADNLYIGAANPPGSAVLLPLSHECLLAVSADFGDEKCNDGRRSIICLYASQSRKLCRSQAGNA